MSNSSIHPIYIKLTLDLFLDDNESDFEDNITVTVPPAHLTSHVAFEKRNYHHRHGSRLYPPGLDTPPKPLPAQATTQEDRSHTPTIDEKETYSTIPSTEDRARNIPSTQPIHHQHPQPVHSHGHLHNPPPQTRHPENIPPHVQNQNGYGAPPPQHYQQQPAPIPRPYIEGGEYPNVMYGGQYQPRPYDQMGGGYRERPKGPYMGPRIPYGQMHGAPMNMRGPRPIMGQQNIAQVYQGVQAKVGHG